MAVAADGARAGGSWVNLRVPSRATFAGRWRSGGGGGGSSWRNSGGGGGHYASGANSVSLGSRDTNQMNGYGSQQQTSYYSV